MERDIINASSQCIGKVIIDDNFILILNGMRPGFFIIEPKIILAVKNKDTSVILSLYDDYTLTIAEIAALFDYSYHTASLVIKSMNPSTSMKSGRRNSSYKLKFTETRKENMRKSQKGLKKPRPNYVMPIELREQISRKLKEGYRSGRIVIDKVKISQAWKDGKYSNSKMGRGIQGFIYSIKNKKDFYFRSLLELNYLLLLENNSEIIEYEMEPFCVQLEDNHHYTPDLLINKNIVIEIKPRAHLNYTPVERFELEMNGLKKYCNEHGLTYDIWYDDEIGFTTENYKKFLKRHPEIIEKYNIRFKKVF